MELEDRLRQHLSSTGDNLVAPPADAADSMAKAGARRRRRRAVGSSLAAVALVAGGIGIAQVATDNGEQEVQAIGEGDDSTDSDASDTGVPTTIAPGESDGEWAEYAEAGMELPESTGPLLEWTEIGGVDGLLIHSATWTGDSFLGVSGTEQRSTLVGSTDGAEWTPVAGIPEGVDIWNVSSDGSGTVFAWGGDTVIGDPGEPTSPPPTRAFVSRDGGTSWAEVMLPDSASGLPADSQFLQSYSHIGGAAAIGDTVVISVMEHVDVNFPALAAELGLDLDTTAGYGSSDEAFFVCLDEMCNQEQTIPFEELGLSEAELETLKAQFGPGSARILSSVGGAPFTEADISTNAGWSDAVVAANGEFLVSIHEEQGGQVLYASTDGVEWEERNSGEMHMSLIATDGTNLYAQSWEEQGSSIRRSADGGRTWTDSGVAHPGVHGVKAGPAGLVATGDLFTAEMMEEYPMEPMDIEKDGYVVTWNGPSMTIVDTSTGETLYDLGPEEMEADAPPAGLAENDRGGFDVLDPETGEVLVSFTEEDFMAAENDMTTASPMEEAAQPESFFGWSADGETWGWQTTAEAFGVNGWPELVVGDDKVLAVVVEFVDGPAEPTAPAARVFVANVG